MRLMIYGNFSDEEIQNIQMNGGKATRTDVVKKEDAGRDYITSDYIYFENGLTALHNAEYFIDLLIPEKRERLKNLEEEATRKEKHLPSGYYLSADEVKEVSAILKKLEEKFPDIVDELGYLKPDKINLLKTKYPHLVEEDSLRTGEKEYNVSEAFWGINQLINFFKFAAEKNKGISLDN